MKHFMKWMLGLAVVLLVVGLGFVIAGVSLGAGLSDAEFLQNMGSRALHIKDFSKVESYLKGEEKVEHLGELLEDEETAALEYEEYDGKLSREHENHEEEGTYELRTVKNLEIDLKAGELYLEAYSGNEIKVEVDAEEPRDAEVSSGEDFLKIESEKTMWDGEVTVYYPKKLKLDQLKIEVDAGTVILEDEIYTELLDISIGAGELESGENIYAKSSVIKVGAGEVDLEWIETDSLEGSCGVGSMELNLNGKESDYNYYLECGLGEIQIGDNIHSSIADHQEITNGNSKKNISLSCGMGEILLDFED